MKTLYESILDTVNAGKSKFSKKNITGYISSTNLKDIINMSKVRRALKDLYGDPFTNSYCDAQALAMLLTQFEVGPTGGTVHIVNADGEDILWRTVFHYNLNK